METFAKMVYFMCMGKGSIESYNKAGCLGGDAEYRVFLRSMEDRFDFLEFWNVLHRNIPIWTEESRSNGELFDKDKLVLKLQERIMDPDIKNRELSLLCDNITKIKGWIAPTETRNLNYNANQNMGVDDPLLDIVKFQKSISENSIL